MSTGAIDAGIYAFIDKTKGLERLALPMLFYLFSLGGATFGMSEEVIPFSMVMVPFVIALGYDSIVAVTVTYVASQIGNAVSWMSPFSVAIAQGIAGIPVLSGAGFRLGLWVVVTGLGALYMMYYADKIRKNPTTSVMYEIDNRVRTKNQDDIEAKEFTIGHKIILLEMLGVLVWIIWGVMTKGYYIPEIASLTGDIMKKIMAIDKVIGVGEVALSDHKSYQPTFEEFIRVVADARVGGMLSNKAGIVNIHMGDGKSKLEYLKKAIKETEIPPSQFLPTHCGRNPELLEEAIACMNIVTLLGQTTQIFGKENMEKYHFQRH